MVIDGDARIDLAAEQRVHRHAEALADDVPERGVDRRDGRVVDTAARELGGAVERDPQALHVPGGLAYQTPAHPFDRGADGSRRPDALADAGVAVFRRDTREGPGR